MIIEKTDLEEWAKLSDHGDTALIAENSGVSRATIYNAIADGECTERTYTAIKTFYEEKKARLQKLAAQ